MQRHCLLLAVSLAAGSTLAQAAIDPQLAYTAYEGMYDNLYVANADGSNRFVVYKADKVRVTRIDMAPVDPLDPTLRRVAFTEAGVLKVVSFRLLANSVSVLGTTTLDAAGAPYQGAGLLDFSPDGSQLLYVKNTPNANGTGPTDIHLVSVAGGASKLLWTAGLSGGYIVTGVRWTGPGRFAFLFSTTSFVQTVAEATLDVNNDVAAPPVALFTDEDTFFAANNLYGVEDFDVARTRPALVFTTGTPPSSTARTIVEYTLPTQSDPGGFAIRRTNAGGYYSHFASGDTRIVFLRASTRFNNVFEYVARIDVAAPATTTNLTAKGSFGSVDTRP
jgi:hypothetical protein